MYGYGTTATASRSWTVTCDIPPSECSSKPATKVHKLFDMYTHSIQYTVPLNSNTEIIHAVLCIIMTSKLTSILIYVWYRLMLINSQCCWANTHDGITDHEGLRLYHMQLLYVPRKTQQTFQDIGDIFQGSWLDSGCALFHDEAWLTIQVTKESQKVVEAGADDGMGTMPLLRSIMKLGK